MATRPDNSQAVKEAAEWVADVERRAVEGTLDVRPVREQLAEHVDRLGVIDPAE